jgi:hypothetical protein
MPTIPPINFPGRATLAGTCRALAKAQQDNTANLKSVEGVINERTNGERVNINVAVFERVSRTSQVLNELLCFDISTAKGAADAAAANATHTRIGGAKGFKIFVGDKLTEVQFFARKSAT